MTLVTALSWEEDLDLIFKKIRIFKIYLFLAALGLPCCLQAFSSCSKRGPLSSCGAQASLVAEHGLWGVQAQ